MQHAPDVDVVGPLHEEHQMRVAGQLPDAQARQAQFVRVAWRACGRVPPDVLVSLSQGINETHGRRFGIFLEVMGQRLFHILESQLARDDWFGLHDWPRAVPTVRTFFRSPSK